MTCPDCQNPTFELVCVNIPVLNTKTLVVRCIACKMAVKTISSEETEKLIQGAAQESTGTFGAEK